MFDSRTPSPRRRALGSAPVLGSVLRTVLRSVLRSVLLVGGASAALCAGSRAARAEDAPAPPPVAPAVPAGPQTPALSPAGPSSGSTPAATPAPGSNGPATPPVKPSAAPAPPAPVPAATFASPEAAAKALFAALAANDDRALVVLFGTAGKDLVEDGRDPMAALARKEDADAASEWISYDRPRPGTVMVKIGPAASAYPVPIVGADGAWSFDAAAGREPLFARQVLRHEREALELCRAYAEAQQAYARVDRDGDRVREYAQRLVSREGRHDGLYWDETLPCETGEKSPLPRRVAMVKDLLDPKAEHVPYGGYYWMILRAQGSHAPGGTHSYVINGNMIAGFGLVGVPAVYGVTGTEAFLTSHHGSVYQKDLGEPTRTLFRTLSAFDPDDTWTELAPRPAEDPKKEAPPK